MANTIRIQLMEKVIARICAKNLSGIPVSSLMLNEMTEAEADKDPAFDKYYFEMTDNQYTRFINEALRWAKYDTRSKKIQEGMSFHLLRSIYLPDEDRDLDAGTYGEITGFNNYGAICKSSNSYYVFDGREGILEFNPVYR